MAKFLTADIVEAILERTGAQDGDMIFFGADNKKWLLMRWARCV